VDATGENIQGASTIDSTEVVNMAAIDQNAEAATTNSSKDIEQFTEEALPPSSASQKHRVAGSTTTGFDKEAVEEDLPSNSSPTNPAAVSQDVAGDSSSPTAATQSFKDSQEAAEIYSSNDAQPSLASAELPINCSSAEPAIASPVLAEADDPFEQAMGCREGETSAASPAAMNCKDAELFSMSSNAAPSGQATGDIAGKDVCAKADSKKEEAVVEDFSLTRMELAPSDAAAMTEATTGQEEAGTTAIPTATHGALALATSQTKHTPASPEVVEESLSISCLPPKQRGPAMELPMLADADWRKLPWDFWVTKLYASFREASPSSVAVASCSLPQTQKAGARAPAPIGYSAETALARNRSLNQGIAPQSWTVELIKREDKPKYGLVHTNGKAQFIKALRGAVECLPERMRKS
jgi:hypothetical protein